MINNTDDKVKRLSFLVIVAPGDTPRLETMSVMQLLQ